MTNQEAFYIVGNIPIPTDDKSYDICQYQEAKAIALDCIQKVDDRTIKLNPNFNLVYCVCGNPICYQTDRVFHHYNYCCECGRKIEWIKENNNE